jgi:hypothetical protein
MQVIQKQDLLPPGVCLLCEQTPAEGVNIVDTSRSLVTGFPFSLQGVKYLCAPCVQGVAELLGLVPDEKEKAAVTAKETAEAKLTAVLQHIEGLAKNLLGGELNKVADQAPYVQAAASEPVVEQDSLAAAVEAGVDPGAVSVEGSPEPPVVEPNTPAEQVVDPSSTPKSKKDAAS